jgi:hypothetical protein
MLSHPFQDAAAAVPPRLPDNRAWIARALFDGPCPRRPVRLRSLLPASSRGVDTQVVFASVFYSSELETLDQYEAMEADSAEAAAGILTIILPLEAFTKERRTDDKCEALLAITSR